MNDLRYSSGLLKTICGDGHRHRKYVVRIESGINRLQFQKRADEKRGSDYEDECKCHLTDHQHGADFAAAKTNSGATAALVERGGKVGTRRADGRNQPEQNSSEYGDAESEQQHMQIQGNR